MDLKEQILSKYETYVTMKQPHNTTPIFLKEAVLEAMEEYRIELTKELSDGNQPNSENANIDIFDVMASVSDEIATARKASAKNRDDANDFSNERSLYHGHTEAYDNVNRIFRKHLL